MMESVMQFFTHFKLLAVVFGGSQAVRLPKKYRFVGTEVGVKHFGNGVLLLPVDDPWQMLAAGLATFEPGFVLARDQPEDQVRAEIAP
jgi:antitoxin VapB